jgi:hypothetical protein
MREVVDTNKIIGSKNTCSKSLLKDPNIAEHLTYLFDKYVVPEWSYMSTCGLLFQ